MLSILPKVTCRRLKWIYLCGVNATLAQQFEIIADGLADQGIAIVDQFLTPEEATAIASLDGFSKALLQFKKAGIGKLSDKTINESIRGDYIEWIDKNLAPPALHVYLARLDQLMQYVNQTLFLSLQDYELHQTVYPVGAFYKRHLDQFKKDDRRKLSVICYLNANWQPEQGGQLRVYSDGDTLDVLPEAGRLVCFRSDLLEHEVLPALRERISITGWMLDRPAWQ